MERWGVATNSLYRTASVHKEEGPWWVFFIEWFSMFVCDLLHKLPSVPLPNWEICRDCLTGSDLLEPGETTTMREWHGDLAGLWHSEIDEPIVQWCLDKYERTALEVSYDEVEARMPDALYEFDDDEEEDDGSA